jgi:hypothetical protein
MFVMTRPTTAALAALLCAALGGGNAAQAADDTDALALEATPAAPAASSDKPVRAFAEVAVGHIDQRLGQPGLASRRVSLDLVAGFKLAPGWRAVLSNRLDHILPNDTGKSDTLNSLREAYVSWQQEGGGLILEGGRINLRQGPAYGYNPTDYFRAGALRAATTADPFALRENRLGTVMLRAQRLWADDALSLALAPKLADAPSSSGASLDLGATNAHSKALLSWSHKFSDQLNTQLSAYTEQGGWPQLGASATALLSASTVAHLELSSGKTLPLLGTPLVVKRREHGSAGLTHTLASGWSLTAEYEYNGTAPSQAQWDAAARAGGPGALLAYQQASQDRQDIAARSAWLLYASKKDALTKNLDLTALVRVNAADHSSLFWVEGRYHLGNADLSLQWLSTHGSALSEFGVLPYRRQLQVLATWFF